MIIVLGSVIVAEGGFDEALALSREHVARSRQALASEPPVMTLYDATALPARGASQALGTIC
jgi:hypothetical protein